MTHESNKQKNDNVHLSYSISVEFNNEVKIQAKTVREYQKVSTKERELAVGAVYSIKSRIANELAPYNISLYLYKDYSDPVDVPKKSNNTTIYKVLSLRTKANYTLELVGSISDIEDFYHNSNYSTDLKIQPEERFNFKKFTKIIGELFKTSLPLYKKSESDPKMNYYIDVVPN